MKVRKPTRPNIRTLSPNNIISMWNCPRDIFSMFNPTLRERERELLGVEQCGKRGAIPIGYTVQRPPPRFQDNHRTCSSQLLASASAAALALLCQKGIGRWLNRVPLFYSLWKNDFFSLSTRSTFIGKGDPFRVVINSILICVFCVMHITFEADAEVRSLEI